MIAKHLHQYIDNLPAKMKIEQVDCICAFTGNRITQGVALKHVISDVFTDWSFVRYASDYVSVDVVLTIAEVIPGLKGFNSLRNYSFYADENEFRILRREEVMDTLLNIPGTPFVMGVTYSNKKHIGFKCSMESDKWFFHVVTDVGKVFVNRDLVDEVLPVMKRWYAILPGKENTEAKPTIFTKDEIRYGNAYYHRQLVYGRDIYEAENEFLRQYRGSQLFELLLFALNKTIS